MKLIKRAFPALMLSAAMALPAAAQDMTDGGPAAVKAALTAYGHAVTDAPPRNGMPVMTVFSEDIAANFEVRYDGCEASGECALLTFSAGFSFDDGSEPASYEDLNEWNASSWGKAVRDGETVWFVVEVNRHGGLTGANLADTIDWWSSSLIDFVGSIGWEAAS